MILNDHVNAYLGGLNGEGVLAIPDPHEITALRLAP